MLIEKKIYLEAEALNAVRFHTMLFNRLKKKMKFIIGVQTPKEFPCGYRK